LIGGITADGVFVKRQNGYRRILAVQVAALSRQVIEAHPEPFRQLPLSFQPLQSVFPAVTCTAQATFRTGLAPAEHGIIANGRFERKTRKTEFWNQAAALLPPTRIWTPLRAKGGTVAELFCQQSLGDTVDLLLSPAPVHKHSGGIVQDCYAKPSHLYRDLCQQIGRKFNLFSYWGPLASAKSSRWIAAATRAVISNPALRPDFVTTYLPHLDYVLQKKGPDDAAAVQRAVKLVTTELRSLCRAAEENGYGVLIWGDYAITPARHPIYPNRELREHGFFRERLVAGRSYPDLYESTAFAMVDHQVAHVYVQDPQKLREVRQLLSDLDGVAEVRTRAECLDHPDSGELIMTAEAGAWFAYPWWSDSKRPPDYATHVDIHNKIGFDPCELFWGGYLPPSVSLEAERVKGTHGRDDAPAAFACNMDLPGSPTSLLELSQSLATLLAAE
jgi:predicted AlkP superfamily pyrophosphatase or phosphodiesterase